MSKANGTGAARDDLTEADDAISRALVAARTSASPLDGFPGDAPAFMAHAYAIQAASIERWPDTVAGWKVGMLSPQDQSRYSAERLTGPIFRAQIHEVAPGASIVMPIFVGGFAAIEAEFVFKLGEAIDASNRECAASDLVDWIAGLYVGAEIASSPMAAINELGPTVVAADFGNNAGLVLGPEIPNWRSVDPADLSAKVIVDGDVVGEASAAAIPGGPLAALRFAVSTASARNIELPAGTLISTGAATGIHDVQTSSVSRIEFGEHGGFDVTFEPMRSGQ